ncbi:MAG: enoyl-CoA hydratase/isomerase family protein [Thermodesulfobacteriota bacterium]
MLSKPTAEQNSEFFSAEQHEHIAIIRFKGHFLYSTTDLTSRDKLLDYLDRISKTESIKVIVIMSSPEKTGSEELLDFYRRILRSKLGINAIHRMFNVVDQFILKLVDLNKIVVHANRGENILLFLNISLSCDYRIVSNSTVFQNPYPEFGLIPKGGGGYFLPKLLGRKKAFELLLSGKNIAAPEALSLGLVDEIVHPDKIEEATINTALRFAGKPAGSLFGIKRLLKYSIKDLREYLELENQVLLRIVQSPDQKSEFWKKILQSDKV